MSSRRKFLHHEWEAKTGKLPLGNGRSNNLDLAVGARPQFISSTASWPYCSLAREGGVLKAMYLNGEHGVHCLLNAGKYR